MSFHIVNEKKTFGNLQHAGLLTEHALSVLKASVQAKWDTLSIKEQSKWADALNALDACKPVEAWSTWNKNDQPNPKYQSYYGPGLMASKGIVDIGSFTSKSPDNSSFPADIAQWGLEQASAVAPFVSLIEQWIGQEDLKITFNASVATRAKKMKERFGSGEYTQVFFDATESLAEVDACVVFLSNKNGGGYLDGRGGVSPLAGARLFESSGSAYTTIRSRRLHNAAVVHVKTSLLHLDPNSLKNQTFGNFDGLTAAIALQEKKRLEGALEAASVEQLRARLHALEDSVGANAESGEKSERKRRM